MIIKKIKLKLDDKKHELQKSSGGVELIEWYIDAEFEENNDVTKLWPGLRYELRMLFHNWID